MVDPRRHHFGSPVRTYRWPPQRRSVPIPNPSSVPEVLSSAASITGVTLGRLQAPLRARRSSLSPSSRPFSFSIFFLASFSHFSNTFTAFFEKRFDILLLLSIQRIDAFRINHPPTSHWVLPSRKNPFVFL